MDISTTLCMHVIQIKPIVIEKFQRTILSQRASVLRLSPRKRSMREKTRRREKREMNGRRRPQRDVQESEIWPIRGTCRFQRFPCLLVWTLITVKSARKGATPRMIDMFVSVKPAWKEDQVSKHAIRDVRFKSWPSEGAVVWRWRRRRRRSQVQQRRRWSPRVAERWGLAKVAFSCFCPFHCVFDSVALVCLLWYSRYNLQISPRSLYEISRWCLDRWFHKRF